MLWAVLVVGFESRRRLLYHITPYRDLSFGCSGRNPDKLMVAADATVRAAHNRQTASRHRVFDANALASCDSRLVTRQLRGRPAATGTAAADWLVTDGDWPSDRLPRRCSETVVHDFVGRA